MSAWRGTLEPNLSQGDIVRGVPIGSVVVPLTKLTARSFKGGISGYVIADGVAPDENGLFQLLARGPVADVVVLSHSCELDKNESKRRVIVAMVSPLSTLHPDARATVAARGRISLVRLLDVPGLGDCYGDLRTATNVDRRHVAAGDRIASMTEDAVVELRESIAGYFARP